MKGPACGPGSPCRANPLRKASGSCLSLARMSTALLSAVPQVFNSATMGGGGGGRFGLRKTWFGLRETWFDLREGCAKLF